MAFPEEFLERWLCPYPFLAGVILSFLLCCCAGRWAAERPLYRQFVRFHRYISPEAQFFPTVSQIRQLERDTIEKDRIAVIIGGNSILHGVGQRPENIWSRHLQELLGNDFRVLNLAMRGAQGNEFGGVMAEVFQMEHPRLLFVTVASSAGLTSEPDGGTFRYLFWEAFARGWLLPFPVREEYLARKPDNSSQAVEFRECRLRAQLDFWTHFQDLWTTFTYETASLVWNRFSMDPIAAGSGSMSVTCLRPRRDFGEPATAQIPVEQRYLPTFQESGMKIVKSFIKSFPAQTKESHDHRDFSHLATILQVGYPESLRARTLIVTLPDSPYYVDQLPTLDREQYRALFPALVASIERAGFPALACMESASPGEYHDRCHLSEEGGRRMATQIATKLLNLADRLGYRRQGAMK